MSHDLSVELKRFVGLATGPRRVARDPVNAAMIRHWCDAMGDTDPRYTGDDPVAPPTMLQAWTMPGLKPPDAEPTVMRELFAVLDEAGFTSIVATNSDQTYERYLRVGDLVHDEQVIEDISGRKDTALGEGHFVTLRTTYTDQRGEVVGTMLFRVLKFRPGGRSRVLGFDALRAQLDPRRPRPAISDDTRFFWDGLRVGELRIQRCASCGALRHPPRPMCGRCRSLESDHVVASGRGTVYSHVTHHHPPLPAPAPPFVVVLVELDEGVRLVSNLEGAEPAIGQRVRAEFYDARDGLWLHRFVPEEA